MWGIITGLAVLVLMLICPVAVHAADISEREESCGWAFPVAAYSAGIAGLSIELPAPGVLIVNGKKLVNEDTRPWGDSHNRAHIARIGKDILITANTTDCVDDSLTYVYILNSEGGLRTFSRQWAENVKSFYAREKDAIIFMSEYYCAEGNPERKPGQSYVYVLRDGASAFVREDRPSEALCTFAARRQRGVYLSLMQPR
jgi:hypothetical protein